MPESADLSTVPLEALRIELARREQQAHGAPGADYYFFAEEDADADEPGQWLFSVVHRRWWHRHHSVLDQHIGGHIILPSGFGEVMESAFEYDGPVEDGKRLLREYGYAELDRSGPHGAMWGTALAVVFIRVAEENHRIDCTCDTAQLHALVAPDQHRWNEPETFRSFASLEAYREDIVSRSTGLVFDIWGRDALSASLMTEEVARSLPPYPDWLQE